MTAVASQGTIAAGRRAWGEVGREAVWTRLFLAMLLAGTVFGAAIAIALRVVQESEYGLLVAGAAVAVIVAAAIVYEVVHRRRHRVRRDADSSRRDLLARFGAREPAPIPAVRSEELRELALRERPRALRGVVGLAIFGIALAGGAIATALMLDSWIRLGGLFGAPLGLAIAEAVRLARAQRLYERTAESAA